MGGGGGGGSTGALERKVSKIKMGLCPKERNDLIWRENKGGKGVKKDARTNTG